MEAWIHSGKAVFDRTLSERPTRFSARDLEPPRSRRWCRQRRGRADGDAYSATDSGEDGSDSDSDKRNLGGVHGDVGGSL